MKIVKTIQSAYLAAGVKSSLALSAAMGFALPAAAQEDFSLPDINIPGVDDDSGADTVVKGVFTYVMEFIVWILVAVAVAGVLKGVVSAGVKTYRDSDGKWGDVIKESVGGVAIIFLAIGLGFVITNTIL